MSHLKRPIALRVLAAAWALGPLACVTTIDSPDQPPASIEQQASAKRDVGMDHLGRGRLALAIRSLLDAERMNPSDNETHLWLGEAYRRKGMLEKAEEQLLIALELDPAYHATRLNLSGLYIQMERYEDAIEQCRVLVDDPTFPTPWRALTNEAWAQYKLGRLEESRVTLERALDFHPKYWPALLNMGILESDTGHRLEALERFEEVLAQNPGRSATAEVNYRMAEVYVALGHRERAIRHFSEVLDETPYGIRADESKRYLKMLR